MVSSVVSSYSVHAHYLAGRLLHGRSLLRVLAVVLVRRILVHGAAQLDQQAQVGLLNLEVLPISLVSLCNHLEAHRRADFKHVDDRLPIFVGLQLHVALVVTIHLVENH